MVRIVTDLVGDFRNNTQYLTGDVNGDGAADLIEVWQNGAVYSSTSFLNNGQGLFSTGVVTDLVGDFRDNTQYLTGDVNGDGAADLIEVWQNGAVYSSTSFLNNGQGLFSTGVVTDLVGDFRDNTQYLTGDVNGDGAADLIEVWQNGAVYSSTSFLNNGQGLFSTGVVTDLSVILEITHST
ncbi:hypothetical protein H6G97_42300 [Nostoc flagelliforme FACHB-838]|uniref:Uncharacterized protein n=1 Tax=Nostoc flagelliforme FACHB-838 TaxID=2692904 RepID=A0ABR8E1Q2_9NOSO|nr:hypothetical protein [Nostoc flagelliforme]MBD2535652.1 hypothetical protein [Nostoc flagelliforme FACHB-838]